MDMDGVDRHEWRCPNGHVLGLVRRSTRRIRQLALLRQANGPEDDVIAVLEGTSDIVCSVCGYSRTWAPGEEAIRDLLVKMGRSVALVEADDETQES